MCVQSADLVFGRPCYDPAHMGRVVVILQRKMPSKHSILPWRWRQYALPKILCPPSTLGAIVTQKIEMLSKHSILPWRWRQYALPKPLCPPSTLRAIVTPKIQMLSKHSIVPWSWRQYVLPKLLCPPSTLGAIVTQKIQICIIKYVPDPNSVCANPHNCCKILLLIPGVDGQGSGGILSTQTELQLRQSFPERDS